MALEGDKIKYSDLVSPDSSITELISQLEQLNKSYGVMLNAVRAGAEKIAHAMKQMSGATSEGRNKIDESVGSVNRLERAQKELKFALSETGQQVAWLKAQTADVNKVTVEQERAAKMLASSYERLKQDLKENIQLWKALSDAEREDAQYGGQVLDTIVNLKARLAELDSQLKPTIESMSKLEKAEKELAYLQTEEGKKLMETNARIRELKAEYSGQTAEVDNLTKAKQNLEKALSDENKQLQQLKLQTDEANRIAKLEVQLANSKEGSYDRLSAQYQLNKIELNKMSGEMRNTTIEGQKLEQETKDLYRQMIVLQEATGNHRLSVGNYTKAWNGLGMSVNQIVRELPSLTVGVNTFFLAISNNIPILIDELGRLKEKNAALKAQGKPTEKALTQIASALVSWQTALTIGITLLSMYGKEVVEWAEKLIKGKASVLSLQKALVNINKELETTNGSYGDSVVTLKKLSDEWKNLETVAEKNQFIRDNASEFRKLDVEVRNVNQAENVLVKNTEAVITAFTLRAKAAAAQKLAAEEYEKALRLFHEAEVEAAKEGKGWGGETTFLDFMGDAHSIGDNLKATWIAWTAEPDDPRYGGVYTEGLSIPRKRDILLNRENTIRQDRIKALQEEGDAANAAGDAYMNLSNAYIADARTVLSSANIGESTKEPKNPKEPKEPKEPKDLTDTIYRNHITILKKYEQSVTNLIQNEYIKRKKLATDQANEEIARLKELFRKNKEYLDNTDGEYKALTKEQKAMVNQQQAWIETTIANTNMLLDRQLLQIENEQKINELQNERTRSVIQGFNTEESKDSRKKKAIISTDLFVKDSTSVIEDSLIKERNLLVENLELEYASIITANQKLVKSNSEFARTEAALVAELQSKKLAIYTEFDKRILSLRASNIENQLALAKKGSEEELNLLIEKNSMERQLALAENAAADAEKKIDTGRINALFDKKEQQIKGKFELENYEATLEKIGAEFNIVKRSSYETTLFTLQQEKERWEKQIELAKSGGLEWSDEQIAIAEATVKKINREIDEASSFSGLIGDKGLGGALLTKLGFDDDQIAALEDATNVVLDNLSAIFDAEVELAEKEVELAKERVDATKSAYEAEIEARNNGYANNVATAKKEMQLAKKNQREKQKLLEEAQRKQQAVDTVTQTSSLVTAAANIWSVFSKTNPFLAIATITTMFGSFAAAKIKAAQVARASEQEYGEGGLEFLEGGSHASGNDIDLGTKNSRGKNMRAEGGEAMAIINKRSTRKYRKHLPLLIDSLNKGIFEDKYLNAFDIGERIQAHITTNPVQIDISKIERDVTEIKKQNSTKYYSLNNGTILIVKGNVKRYIR